MFAGLVAEKREEALEGVGGALWCVRVVGTEVWGRRCMQR